MVDVPLVEPHWPGKAKFWIVNVRSFWKGLQLIGKLSGEMGVTIDPLRWPKTLAVRPSGSPAASLAIHSGSKVFPPRPATDPTRLKTCGDVARWITFEQPRG